MLDFDFRPYLTDNVRALSGELIEASFSLKREVVENYQLLLIDALQDAGCFDEKIIFLIRDLGNCVNVAFAIQSQTEQKHKFRGLDKFLSERKEKIKWHES